MVGTDREVAVIRYPGGVLKRESMVNVLPMRGDLRVALEANKYKSRRAIMGVKRPRVVGPEAFDDEDMDLAPPELSGRVSGDGG